MKRGILFSIIVVVFVVGISIFYGLPQATLASLTDASISTQKNIYIDSEQTINDNFVGFGETINIYGPVNGDIIVAGSTINIDSTVQGDIIAAGNTLNIKGEVLGNIRVAGNIVDLDAVVGKNVNVVANTFSTTPKSSVGWSLAYGAATANIKGSVGGHVDGNGSANYISAKIGGNTNVYTYEENGKINITDSAEIAGNFTYSSINPPTISDSAIVSGNIIEKEPLIKPVDKNEFFRFLGISGAFFKIINIFSIFVIGLIIVSVMKNESIKIIDYMQKEASKSFGWGIGSLILIPIISFALLFTIIGVPLAIIIMTLYFIAIYVSKVFIGLLIGRWVLINIKGKKKAKSFSMLLAMVIGVTFFFVITSVPVIGWLINMVAIVWAFGAIIQIKKQYLAESNK